MIKGIIRSKRVSIRLEASFYGSLPVFTAGHYPATGRPDNSRVCPLFSPCVRVQPPAVPVPCEISFQTRQKSGQQKTIYKQISKIHDYCKNNLISKYNNWPKVLAALIKSFRGQWNKCQLKNWSSWKLIGEYVHCEIGLLVAEYFFLVTSKIVI